MDHGFRLPSALDNRPLRFDEFMARQKQLVYMSATPGPFEYVNCVAGNKAYIPVLKAKRGNTHARSQRPARPSPRPRRASTASSSTAWRNCA